LHRNNDGTQHNTTPPLQNNQCSIGNYTVISVSLLEQRSCLHVMLARRNECGLRPGRSQQTAFAASWTALRTPGPHMGLDRSLACGKIQSLGLRFRYSERPQKNTNMPMRLSLAYWMVAAFSIQPLAQGPNSVHEIGYLRERRRSLRAE
jgi:hypothetical protein